MTIQDNLSLLRTSQDEIRLGIWGTSGAGKTTYLTRLYGALIQSGRWEVQIDDNAERFINQNLAKIDGGEFPERTRVRPGEPLPIYSYTLIPKPSNNITNKTVVLRFIDAPGGFYEDLNDYEGEELVSDGENESSMDIVDYLLNCHGIIFLIDPMRTRKDGESYFMLLGKLFRKMQSRQQLKNPNQTNAKLEQYAVLGVTKVEIEEFWQKAVFAVKFVLEILGSQASLDWLSNFFWLDKNKVNPNKGTSRPNKKHRCEFFSICTIGGYRDKDGKLLPGIVKISPNNQPSNISNSNEESIFQQLGSSSEQSISNINDDVESLFGDNTTPLEYIKDEDNILIKINEILIPFNVIEPIEWLIDGIQRYRPSL